MKLEQSRKIPDKKIALVFEIIGDVMEYAENNEEVKCVIKELLKGDEFLPLIKQLRKEIEVALEIFKDKDTK